MFTNSQNYGYTDQANLKLENILYFITKVAQKMIALIMMNEGQDLNRLRNNATLASCDRLFRDSSLKFVFYLQEISLDFFFHPFFQ